jgi:hypothetical protein
VLTSGDVLTLGRPAPRATAARRAQNAEPALVRGTWGSATVRAVLSRGDTTSNRVVELILDYPRGTGYAALVEQFTQTLGPPTGRLSEPEAGGETSTGHATLTWWSTRDTEFLLMSDGTDPNARVRASLRDPRLF